MIIKNKKGFSLIELLVIIAIIGIMTAVSIVSLTESKKKKDVEVATREVAATIREAQNYSLTGKTKTTSERLCAANFKIMNLSSYRLEYQSISATGGATCPATYVRTGDYYSKSLMNGVQFSSSNSTTEVNFSVPHGEVSPASTTAIILNKGSNTQSVCVYQSGRVEEVSGAACP